MSRRTDGAHLLLLLLLWEFPCSRIAHEKWRSDEAACAFSVSRIPNVDFLVDRPELAHCCRQSGRRNSEAFDGHTQLDLSSTFYVLNPSGDLEGTERCFSPWLKSMRAVGWNGIIGQANKNPPMSIVAGNENGRQRLEWKWRWQHK
jgi:Peptidase family C50